MPQPPPQRARTGRGCDSLVIGLARTKVLARKSIFRRMLAVGTMGLTPVTASDHILSEHL